MAEILPDNQLRSILGKVIVNGDETLINPNGIELRVGKTVFFHSTDEEYQFEEGTFLKVKPGETILFTSFETIDFTDETVAKLFPGECLMALITPTTTMMREGIAQVTTKIDPGFRGVLNWSLRNEASKDIVLKYKEPIFKLTIFKLSANEKPDVLYGQRENDSYQNTDGINYSKRTLPASIPKNKIIESSFGKLDPKKQLKEAGYPFNYIGTELTELQGKFEVVSKDVLLVKEEFQKKTQDLSDKIFAESESLKLKIDNSETHILDKSKVLFSEQFLRIVGVLVAAISIMYGGAVFLQQSAVSQSVIAFLAVVSGIAVLFIVFILSRKFRLK